ncbi:Glycosyltransferase 2-like domain-containing protein [Cupriavidus necator]|uniref:glycosyltransferase n=1 Tax=Cupriavidus necator TaxID=106590 RepID=UPI003F73EBF6
MTKQSSHGMLDVIFVNWNGGNQLLDALGSIAMHHSALVHSVVIVDNASADDSLAQVIQRRSEFPFDLKIVANTENKGFGAACNQGAALAAADFLLFLNPDTRLFRGSLSTPIAYLLDPENVRIGVAGIQLIDDSGKVSRSCSRFPGFSVFLAQVTGLNRLPAFSRMSTHMAEWPHDETRRVDHVIGAFYLMPRALFEALHGFDERFFVYLEDLDLSLRVHQAGYQIVYLATAQAFHAGGGTSRKVKARRLFYSLRSRLLYGRKHFRPVRAAALLAITLGIEPLTRTAFSLLGGHIDDVRDTWKAYAMLVADLPRILRR